MHRHRAPSLPVPATRAVARRSTERSRAAPGSRNHVRTTGEVAAADRRLFDVLAFEELAPLVADPRLTDVLVIGGHGVWTDGGDGLVPVHGMRIDEARTRELAAGLVALGDRHVDETTPLVDVRLGAGIRVHVVLAPVATPGTSISVRIPQRTHPTLERLAATGFFDRVARDVVERAVGDRRNILVSGATGSGKTTLLAAMCAAVPADERIVTVEDVAELRIDHPHVLGLESRQANGEGTGAIGLDRLVREALRMRPDRIVLGECRGAEVRDLMSALNTGHDGGAGTLHANSAADVPARLEALGALAGLDPLALARQAVSAFDLVVHVERRHGIRRIGAVAGLAVDDSGRLVVTDIGAGRRAASIRRTDGQHADVGRADVRRADVRRADVRRADVRRSGG